MTPGAATADTDACECGHVRDEHGDDTGLYPNATPCTIRDCHCVIFERDPHSLSKRDR